MNRMKQPRLCLRRQPGLGRSSGRHRAEFVYESESLSEQHVLESFDCGKVALNDWLMNSARHCQSNRTASTFVWRAPSDPHVVAYYSLAGHVVEKQALPPKLGRGSPEQMPAVLLARLAIDKTLQGQGLGGVLLADAMGQVVAAVQRVAARFVIVDALDEEAAAFYDRYGFKRIPGHMRMYRKISDIERSLSLD
ncbi:GNAT family N-acetyltransferase [Streptomyces sp. NPDC047042]|uniref:GNAT family N-acetyltransferase n=1 Tax=Streptomyces sp. NPDC047042 TaxID=3154807 RepID=UPI0033DFD58A